MNEQDRVSEAPDPTETVEIVPGLGPSTVLDELGEVEFPIVRRGYDRASVDHYIDRVVSLVIRLDAGRTPEQAVQEALDRVGEQTAGILRQARESAAQMTASAESDARERVAEADRDAERIHADALAKVRKLDADTDRIWEERQRLIEATRKLADSVLKLADDADERLPPEQADGPGPPDPEPAGEPSASDE